MKETKEGEEKRLGPSNIGYKLLKKAGWSDGEALGKNQDGIKSPVQPSLQKGRAGLGKVVKEVSRKKRKAAEPGDAACGDSKVVCAKRRREAEIEERRRKQQVVEMYREFREPDAGAEQFHPLKSKSRLSATNPLLDD
ncbi:G-patch domain-containing protein [Chloropicon primus]|uniref:G-patch domain-containing protein n=1 Tax=Chloropicon primus TaxID=1764295 RepID=A0A5B8MT25_9CHLO|nr:hypothetical protein A3770_08p50980 [Chloropicon primus]UPR01802.1 G-patch domain-containing protein [Chloropicon primus]|mmetsp:Transcript_8240/g.23540  ORF Transcript_8240/g.23540 Transcript_8240/m.23540 type:complete len:138 (-) Transcript_8240:4042-4455(-)|eukprot:QDZ22580.1 hypothetical protein A3770_08p50980 [Chloropicon primus]